VNLFEKSAFQVAYEAGNVDICEHIRLKTSKTDSEDFRKDAECRDPDAFLHSSTSLQKPKLYQSSRLFKNIYVHLDLKGAPPTFDFLQKFIRFVGVNFKHLVTGIVFEFEDTFPYEGHLQSVCSPKAYTKA